MPQIFQVLRCYKCSVFQVHQAKKSNKFQCKLCGEKQSIKRSYGIGTSKECRVHVQKLNGLRQEVDELNNSNNSYSDTGEVSTDEEKPKLNPKPKKSKWSGFVNSNNEKSKENSEFDSNEPMMLGDAEVVLEVPKKKFRKPPPSNKRDNDNFYQLSGSTKTKTLYLDSNLTENSHLHCNEILMLDDKEVALKMPKKKFQRPQLNEPDSPDVCSFRRDSTKTENLLINSHPNITSKKTIQNRINKKQKEDILVSTECSPLKSDILNLIDKLPKSNCRDSKLNLGSGKQSKWAQFVDDKPDHIETEDEYTSQNTKIHKDINTIFSLTENEDELNELLDF